MAAYIVRVSEADWPVVRHYLNELQQGGIIVPPEVAVELERQTGEDFPDGELIEDYDFYGEADIWVDVALTADGFPGEAIVEHVRDTRE